MTQDQIDKLLLIQAVLNELQTPSGSDTGSVHLANTYIKELLGGPKECIHSWLNVNDRVVKRKCYYCGIHDYKSWDEL